MLRSGIKTTDIFLLGCLLLILGRCSADVAQQVHPKGRDASPTPSASLSSQDREFIEQAAEGNRAEVAIGALVDGRALRPEVAAFGHMMVNDHSAANEQLAAIAVAHHIALPTSLGEHQAGFDRVVDRQLDPFDRELMRVMLGDHQEAVELFRSEASGGTDPQLKAFASARLPMIESHLRQAAALSDIARVPQELSEPPTPDATQPPPASPVNPSRP
jgi:putative membrane protein